MPPFLVNDQCLRRPATGVAIYLRNVLANWPKDAGLQPEGFSTDLTECRNPVGPPTPSAPLCPSPLQALRSPGPLTGRVPWWVRRIAQKSRVTWFAHRFRRGGYVACFEPNHLAIPCVGPTVTTIHDLSVLEHPEWHPVDRVRQWQRSLAPSVASTTRWIADSDFSARRMTELLAIPSERITVIPLAARPLRYPTAEALAAGRGRMNLPERYLLHLGTIEPRKNLRCLLDAWSRLNADLRRGCRLVLAGGAGWGRPDFWRGLAEHPMAGEVLCTGYISDEQAAWLLAGASGLLQPSWYEGFGLPILEAMACGTGVVCSTAEALVETAGGAADSVDADDVPGWSEAMTRALEDESWRSAMARSGPARAAEFSWATAAAAHAALLADVAGHGRTG